MNFKEQFLEDFDRTFLNIEEFATDHTIDGNVVRCILDESGTLPLTVGGSQQTGLYYSGTFAGDIHLYAKRADFDYTPQSGSQMEVDGTLYTIQKCSDVFGVLVITLGANLM